MEGIVLSVSEFVSLVNQTLEFAYAGVVVEGEVSEFEVKQAKWVHFKLKDQDSSVECFMVVWNLRLPIQDGQTIKVLGTPKLTKWGRFSLNVSSYDLTGEGNIRKAYEQLKAKLEAEGLFEPSRKRSLPVFPASIGLVTSTESQAFNDFIKIINERWGGIVIQVFPVQVQGLAAPDQIAAALNYFNQLARPVDVVVIIRGGGSGEDLQAFSAETVVRAVAASRTPTIVGVGHEDDHSLADFAADLRASTPTDAARKVVPNRKRVTSQLIYSQRRMLDASRLAFSEYSQELTHHIYALEQFIVRPLEHLAELSSRLRQNLSAAASQITIAAGQLKRLHQDLSFHTETLINREWQRLQMLMRALNSYDPALALKRGYAIARSQAGRIIKSAREVKIGDFIVVQLAKDQLETEVKNVRTR